MSYSILLVLILLVAIVIQDLKFRKIHVFLPVLLFAFSLSISSETIGFNLKIIMTNLVLLTFIIGFLVLYMSLKNRQFLNPFANYFGLGDFLFYIAIIPLFLTFNYLLFFILSMFFSILVQLIFRKTIAEKSVPLAGFSSILLFFALLNDLFLDFYTITIL